MIAKVELITQIAELSQQSFIDKYKGELWENLNLACMTTELVHCANCCNVPCEKAKYALEILALFNLKQVARWN